MGIVAKSRGTARVSEGLDTCGKLISHLVSPAVVIKSSPQGTRVRMISPATQAPLRLQPLIHGYGAGRRPVVDPCGPVPHPTNILIGDPRLEMKATKRAFAREPFATEILSLHGITSSTIGAAVVKLNLGDGQLPLLLGDDMPPIMCRVLSLRLHQHLVPITQESAKRSLLGCATSTRGGAVGHGPVLEMCRFRAADTAGLDVVLLEHDEHFTAGNRTLVVPQGTSVRVTDDRSQHERVSDDGSGCDHLRADHDPSF